MLKWIESTGRTEDAAIEAALAKLGMDRDEVSVEILERAKSGFLGIGSCPAKVKVTYEAPDEPEQVPVKKAPLPRRRQNPSRSRRHPRPGPSPPQMGKRRNRSYSSSPACWSTWAPSPARWCSWMMRATIR